MDVKPYSETVKGEVTTQSYHVTNHVNCAQCRFVKLAFIFIRGQAYTVFLRQRVLLLAVQPVGG